MIGSTFGCLASDEQGNFQIYTYDPNDPEFRCDPRPTRTQIRHALSWVVGAATCNLVDAISGGGPAAFSLAPARAEGAEGEE